MGKKKIFKPRKKLKSKNSEYHLPAVIILVLVGFLSYLYIGNVLFTVYQNSQVLGASTQTGK